MHAYNLSSVVGGNGRFGGYQQCSSSAQQCSSRVQQICLKGRQQTATEHDRCPLSAMQTLRGVHSHTYTEKQFSFVNEILRWFLCDTLFRFRNEFREEC